MFDEFFKLFEYVIKDKLYDFLYIDSCEFKGFCKNFNERLDIKKIIEEVYLVELFIEILS